MPKKIIIIILLFVSCEQKSDSTGEFNEINIFLSNEDSNLIRNDIENLFDVTINTPIEESIYNLKFNNVKDFFDNRYKRNIILVSIDDPPDSTADYFFKKFSSNVQDKNIFIAENYYANNQTMLLINSLNNMQFKKLISDNTNWILDNINKTIDYYKYNDYLLRNELNVDIIEKINNDFKLNISIDENYKIIKHNEQFIWIGRGYPYRWIIVNQIHLGDNVDFWEINKEFLETNINSIKIPDYFKKIITIDGATVLRGLYEHDESDTGGPFFTYIFDNEYDNKVNLISGFVNNPGKDKYYLLKELELIIKNIKTKVKNEK